MAFANFERHRQPAHVLKVSPLQTYFVRERVAESFKVARGFDVDPTRESVGLAFVFFPRVGECHFQAADFRLQQPDVLLSGAARFPLDIKLAAHGRFAFFRSR